MSQSFYYLLSSLPLLSLDEPVRLSDEELLSFCVPSLSAANAARFAAVSLAPDHDPCCEAERGWQVWETHLRNVLSGQRAGRLGRDPAAYRRAEADVFPSDRLRAETVYDGTADPVARERGLDRLRWERLDNLAAGHNFDFDALVIYRLRLLILEKWRRRSAETGLKLRDAMLDEGVKEADRHLVNVESQPDT